MEGENDKCVVKDDDIDGEDKHDKGEYVGVEDSDTNMDESNGQSDINFDGLADIWNEMSVGLESSRVIKYLISISNLHYSYLCIII